MANAYQRNKNAAVVVGGLALNAQAANPIALGDTGLYYDGTTLYWVDAAGNLTPSAGAGDSWHESCRLATAAALATQVYSSSLLTLTSSATGAQQIDSVTVNVGDRILVKDQVDQTHNGIYVVTVKGATGVAQKLTRASDCNTSAMFQPAFLVAVAEGTVNADFVFVFTANAPFTMDTSNATFVAAPLAITYGLVGAMAAAGVAAANAAGVTSSVARIDHVHAPDLAVIADLTTAQALSSKTLTSPVIATGLTASGSAANTFAGSTGRKLSTS